MPTPSPSKVRYFLLSVPAQMGTPPTVKEIFLLSEIVVVPNMRQFLITMPPIGGTPATIVELRII